MATQSILNSTKKVLGIAEIDTSYDADILMGINTVLADLNQLGVGPVEGFEIEDDVATWETFIGTDPRMNPVKSYMYLRLRMLFDPPSTSFALDAMKDQITKFEWRINVVREGDSWIDPTLQTS